MSASGVAVVAAITAVVAWGLKAVAIGLAGGLDRSSLESPLFGLGLVAIVVAFFALGMAVAVQRPLPITIACGFIGAATGFALSMVASWGAAAVIPESAGWVREEAGLWLSALLALIVTAAWHTRRSAARSAA